MVETPTACRRRYRRHPVRGGADAAVSFDFPGPGGTPCSMRLRDISGSGVSFLLEHDLPGLDEGAMISQAVVRVEGHSVRTDLLVMHLTPDATAGSVCGALLFPHGDGDVRALQRLVEALAMPSTEAVETP